MVFELSGKKVWVAGHLGMVGSAITRALAKFDVNIVESRFDFRRQAEVECFLHKARPDVVFLAAAKVGGILANSSYAVDFLYDNVMIESNIIHASYEAGVKKLIFLGSSCIYPRDAEQPMKEEALLTGSLEPTNEWYAIAKIAGLKLCQSFRAQYGVDFISAMPTNLYGPYDNFDLMKGHVFAALIHKIHNAKVNGDPTVTIWGSGKPLREFMHVDDLADALVLLAERYSDYSPINVSTGISISIMDVALLIAKVIGYKGEFIFDSSKPDGSPSKSTDISRLRALGYAPKFTLEEGIRDAYAWFVEHHAEARGI